MDPERVMDGIVEEIWMMSGELAASLKAEDYEHAAELRDDITARLRSAADKLVENRLTKLTIEELDFYLAELKHSFLKDWCENMDIEAPEREEK